MLKKKIQEMLHQNEEADKKYEIIHEAAAAQIFGGDCVPLQTCQTFEGSCESLTSCGYFIEK